MDKIYQKYQNNKAGLLLSLPISILLLFGFQIGSWNIDLIPLQTKGLNTLANYSVVVPSQWGFLEGCRSWKAPFGQVKNTGLGAFAVAG